MTTSHRHQLIGLFAIAFCSGLGAGKNRFEFVTYQPFVVSPSAAITNTVQVEKEY